MVSAYSPLIIMLGLNAHGFRCERPRLTSYIILNLIYDYGSEGISQEAVTNSVHSPNDIIDIHYIIAPVFSVMGRPLEFLLRFIPR